jgi:hypothetical protein
MAENEYDYLEQALPGFSQARLIVKAAGDSIRPLGFKGSKFELSADRPRSGILGSADPQTSRPTPRMTKPLAHAPYLPHQINMHSSRDIKRSGRETSLGARRVVATEGGPVGRALREQASTNDLAVLTHAACIRHIFAHGRLTAHPNGLPADNMTAICDALSGFITDFIRSDFDRRVKLAEIFKP